MKKYYVESRRKGISYKQYKKDKSIGHNCFLKHIFSKKDIWKDTRGRRCKQPLDDPKKKRGYWKLKEEALERTLWRTRFGKGNGHAARQTKE